MSNTTQEQTNELLDLLENGNAASVVDFLVKVPADERRSFHRVVKDSLAECTQRSRDINRAYMSGSRGDWEHLSKLQASVQKFRGNASLAFVITGTPSEVNLRKGLANEFHGWMTAARWARDKTMEERYGPFLRIAREIKPAGLDAYIALFLEGEESNFEWPIIYKLYQEGLIARPESAKFWLGMFGGLPEFATSAKEPLADIIRQNKQWIEPELYTVLVQPEAEALSISEAEAQATEWGRKHNKAEHTSWKLALAQVCDSGDVDREKLTESIFAGLMMHAKPGVLKWLGELFDTLWPQEQWSQWTERGELGFIPLIQSGNAATYNWLAPHLEQIWKDGATSGERILEWLTPMLQSEKKTQVKKAISLIQKIGTKSKALRPAAAARACDALLMDDADVQGRVAKLLAKFAPEPTPEITEALAPYADTLNAAVRAEFAPWLAAAEIDLPPAEPIDELPTEPEPLDPLATPLEPITNIDDLIAVMSHFDQDTSDINEAHRLFNAMAVLSDQVPADIDERAAALHKSFQTFTGGWDGVGMQMKQNMQHLFCAWERCCHPPTNEIFAIVKDTLYKKLAKSKALTKLYQQMLIRHLEQRRGAAMLSAPTHEGGWIAPLALIERYAQLTEAPDSLDAQIALLRLPLPCDPEALEAAKKLAFAWAAPLRYALGDDSLTAIMDDPVWCAAYRARFPEGDPISPEQWAKDFQCDDGARAAQYVRDDLPTGKRKVKTWTGHIDTECPAEIRYQPLDSGNGGMLAAPARLRAFDKDNSWFQQDLLELEWQLSAWPGNRRPLWMQMVNHLSSVTEETDTQFHTAMSKAAAQWLWNAPHPLGEIGHTLLLQVLGCGFSAGRQAGVDALIHLLETGRFERETFGRELAQQLRLNYAKINRIAPALRDVGLAGAGYRHAIGQALGHAFALKDATPPRLISQLLELYWELSSEFPDLRISEESTAWLQTQNKGKTGKISKQILAAQ